jgi:peroxiredoxin
MKTLKILAVMALLASIVACGSRQKKAAAEPVAEETEDMSGYLPQLAVGIPAPALELNTPDGEPIRLADYSGKWLVLDFWASWCPDCRAEFQAVKDLYAKAAPKGVEFLGVSFDDDGDAWRKCLDEQGFAWKQVSNLIKRKDNPVYEAFGIHWIPTMVLVAPDGTVAGSALTAKDMETLLSAKI